MTEMYGLHVLLIEPFSRFVLNILRASFQMRLERILLENTIDFIAFYAVDAVNLKEHSE